MATLVCPHCSSTFSVTVERTEPDPVPSLQDRLLEVMAANPLAARTARRWAQVLSGRDRVDAAAVERYRRALQQLAQDGKVTREPDMDSARGAMLYVHAG
jgi:hypothetical protein